MENQDNIVNEIKRPRGRPRKGEERPKEEKKPAIRGRPKIPDELKKTKDMEEYRKKHYEDHPEMYYIPKPKEEWNKYGRPSKLKFDKPVINDIPGV